MKEVRKGRRKRGKEEAKEGMKVGRLKTVCPNEGFELQNAAYTMPNRGFLKWGYP
jgi:hypothetical protein